MSNFAPYQDTAPDIVRSFSPPLTKSPSPRPQIPKIAASALSPPSSPSYQNDIAYFNPERAWERSTPAQVESSTGFWRSRSAIDLYETSLGIRLDWEACLAYLGLPPAGPVALLMFEHRSDYVRFHAWQSALLFTLIFILHIIFSWAPTISWLLFCIDLCLIAFLTFRAYKDAETLDRYHVPIFGRIANSILDDE